MGWMVTSFARLKTLNGRFVGLFKPPSVLRLFVEVSPWRLGALLELCVGIRASKRDVFLTAEDAEIAERGLGCRVFVDIAKPTTRLHKKTSTLEFCCAEGLIGIREGCVFVTAEDAEDAERGLGCRVF